jgi:ribosomal protein L29
VAKFDDYAKTQNDELEQEISDASAKTDERREAGGELPERFKGKSAEEIAQSYIELEKLNSRQAQNLGQLRKTADELLALQLREVKHGQDKPTTKPVESSDLFDNPDESIRNVAKQEVDTRVKALEAELLNERVARAKGEFTKQFPTWEQDVHDPEFINWINEKPHRVRLARDADSGDFGAAETLFGTYYDQREVKSAKVSKEERRQKVKEVTLETSGAGAPDLETKYSRTALMEKRLAAKRGDRNADHWLRSNAESIAIAYEEGRIVD